MQATCHPDKPHQAHGMCKTCYGRWLRENNGMSPCHPHKKIYARGLCEPCYHKWLKEHKPRYKELERENYLRTKEHKRAVRRKRLYGISSAEIDKILLEQQGLCAICKLKPATHLDHDHTNNHVRGFLCDDCNRGLGSFRDNINSLLNACIYLEQGGWRK